MLKNNLSKAVGRMCADCLYDNENCGLLLGAKFEFQLCRSTNYESELCKIQISKIINEKSRKRCVFRPKNKKTSIKFFIEVQKIRRPFSLFQAL